ncbi:MAG: ketoacyl-ACP synthase III [Deltaproteobacteria bacterium]|nr:ketoacyl-ACP synthase III [Deltaproteobacteria bacterium]
MLRSRIVGTGSAVPKKVVTNHDLEGLVDTTDAWITSRTGISERRIAVNEPCSELASRAGKAALKAADVSPKDLDLIVVGTVTPEMTFPSTACLVQAHLGVRPGATAFDVSAACSGFVYALDVADKFVKAGAHKKALVIGVDQFSRIVDWKDRSTCVLFGDGAGAIVLSAEKGARGVLSCHTHSDGRHWEMLYANGPHQSSHFDHGHHKSPYLRMHGNETFKIAVRTMGSAITEAMEANGLKGEDIDLLIPHQANLRIINAIKDRLKLPDEKLYVNLDRYGNTSAGSIPLALDEAVREGRLKENDTVLFVAFGGGFTWASAVARW